MQGRLSGQLLRIVSARVRAQSQAAGGCSLAWISNPRGTPGAGWLASGNGDNSIVIFDLEDQISAGDDTVDAIPVCTITTHTGPVHALLYVAEQGWLVSGSTDNTIRIWRIRTEGRASDVPAVTVQAVGGVTAI